MSRLELRPPEGPVLGPVPPPASGLDAVFGRYWPEVAGRVPARPGLVLASFVVALVAAATVTHTDVGLGLLGVLLASVGVMSSPLRITASAQDRALAGVVFLLLGTLVLRDAGWAVLLCCLSAYALGSAALSRATTVAGMLVSGLSVPLAWLRGLPWLGRSLVVRAQVRPPWPLLRTLLLCLVLVITFGALFASGDAVFAHWVDLILPTFAPADLSAELSVFGLVLALTLGGTYVALNPPRVERLALGPGRVVRRFEWVAPVVAVIAVFVVFLLAQVSALFGGHAYLQASVGLTYAEYVHQGFGQLTAATAIVLLVVAVTLRHAPRQRPADRRLAIALLGLLCGLAVVVVASALYRIDLYEQAYGFTRLRLLVTVFEIWVGLVLLLVMTVGVWLRARWVPRAAVLAGVGMILGLTLANPDALVARHNVERMHTTGTLDWRYLRGLSDDAVPALDRLPEPYRSCALADRESRSFSGLSWNWSRARAAAILHVRPVDPSARCDFPTG